MSIYGDFMIGREDGKNMDELIGYEKYESLFPKGMPGRVITGKIDYALPIFDDLITAIHVLSMANNDVTFLISVADDSGFDNMVDIIKAGEKEHYVIPRFPEEFSEVDKQIVVKVDTLYQKTLDALFLIKDNESNLDLD